MEQQIEFPLAMNALTVWQPWATLLQLRLKQWETRRQRAILARLAITGEWFAIHAAASTPANVINEAIEREPIKTMLGLHGISRNNRVQLNVPQRAIIAVAKIGRVEPTSLIVVSATERALGDYSPGGWAGEVKDLIALEHPVTVNGSQGLWRVPESVLEQVRYEVSVYGRAAEGILGGARG